MYSHLSQFVEQTGLIGALQQTRTKRGVHLHGSRDHVMAYLICAPNSACWSCHTAFLAGLCALVVVLQPAGDPICALAPRSTWDSTTKERFSSVRTLTILRALRALCGEGCVL